MKKLLLLLLVLQLSSCQDIQNCAANDEQRFMVLEFLDKENENPIEVGFRITASNSPYLFPPFEEDSTKVQLFFDPNASEITFFFVSDTSNHELTMSYETQVSIFDEDCDPSFFFQNLDTVSYSFDSLSIPGTITNRQIPVNVQVFL